MTLASMKCHTTFCGLHLDLDLVEGGMANGKNY
jgi:hypothetical protein